MGDNEAIVERRRQIYGKGRKEDFEQLRKSLVKSSVLQPGEYNLDLEAEKQGIYTTTNAIDFQVMLRCIQIVHIIVLGSKHIYPIQMYSLCLVIIIVL